MNPAEKGWLHEYIQFKKLYPIILNDEFITTKEQHLYKIVQPTGLIYGQAIHSPGYKHPKEQRWGASERMKIVLLESLYHSAALSLKKLPKGAIEWEQFYRHTSLSIGRFYNHLNPRLSKRTIFSLKPISLDNLLFTEKVLDKKLSEKSNWHNFWAGLFHNSFLFLDTYYFGEWYAGRFTNIKWHKDQMKMVLLKVIAAAAYAKHIVERGEKNIFFTFLDSANLTKDQEKAAKEAYREGIKLEQIELKYVDTWFFKKYVLELAILMVWADKVVKEEERLFLLILAKRLGFTETDLDVSLIAIEAFVIDNWKDVYFLQSKHSFQVINQTIHQRIAKVMENNHAYLVNEVKQGKHLNALLEKSKKEILTSEEKDLVRIKLIEVLKTIPAFRYIAIPSNFLTLPILLEILPKDVLPITFQG
ncbi:hypothetical protein GCM10011506_43680 [Marivirga lumbricoides]|uniref:Letm1 RBD domain-containing protein n=1 Tax=Marivirga lumbricoides TaxID=1046115 RepID=A0ABQ1N3X6_9BACT|nr:hypothetical protein GCM10011506_43680 [Marivirga lumbricoides]